MKDYNPDKFPNALEAEFERVITPFQRFIRDQTTGSILLLFCTLFALIIANSPFVHDYEAILQTKVGLVFGDFSLRMSIHHWINDGLMALFFFLLGLEIKREILVGELREPRQSFPVIAAAIGGMVLPASIFAAFNYGSETIHGWGIPMATDTAFAVGILALFGSYIPRALFTFLTALAIIDDLGAIMVIAVFYTESINIAYLGLAGLFLTILAGFNILGIRGPWIYFIGGFFIWLAMLGSGVHATIAGILTALIVPARPKRPPEWFIHRARRLINKFERIEEASDRPILAEEDQHKVVEQMKESAEIASTPLRRWEHILEHPIAIFVMPLFALANAGIPVSLNSLTEMWSEPLSLGIICGLVFGKSIGIGLFCWISLKLNLGHLPKGVNIHHIIGLGFIGGIGFTMAIFIASLGFANNPEAIVAAKSGIIVGSLIAGIMGALWLRVKA